MTDVPKSKITSHEAAAFWGSASNSFYPTEQRLQLAMAALEFFGGFYEEWEEEQEKKYTTSVVLSIPIGEYNPTIAGISEEDVAALCEESNIGDDFDYHFTIVELSV